MKKVTVVLAANNPKSKDSKYVPTMGYERDTVVVVDIFDNKHEIELGNLKTIQHNRNNKALGFYTYGPSENPTVVFETVEDFDEAILIIASTHRFW